MAGALATMNGQPPLVMHVIHHLYTGGMENGLVNLINTLPADAYRHVVMCVEDFSDFRQRIRRPDVEVVALHRSRIGTWGLRRALYRACRERRPAIVHSRGLSGLDALLPARLAGVRHTVHGEHGWDVDDLKGERRRSLWLRRLHMPLVSRYVTVSQDLRRFLVDRVGIADGRISPICNGVDTQRFSPRPAGDDGSWLPAHLQGPQRLRIGTVGRIQPVKDQATLLRAVARLLADRPDQRDRLRLMVVGDGPLLADLRAQAQALGIADQCWFPGAFSDVPRALRAMDLFVLPSLNEGISNTILEAMACGLPVLATGVGGNLELLEEGAQGHFFEPGDDARLAGLIAELADDPALRGRWSAQARQRAVAGYSLERMVAHYRDLYDRLLQGRTALAPGT